MGETPKLTRVLRLDSIPLDATYWTKEGYLIDHPIVTSVGIFEYTNPDGSKRRELRLPENVFDPQSLASYKGKPIIITHSAGVVTRTNVGRESIGTIMSEGYQDGNNVRAEIVIHDTEAMKEAGLKELSLGYTLDLVEEPGVWNDQPYDAIQTNIRVNHLAVVASARAGDQARLNIDGEETKGDTNVKKTNKDSVTMTPEEIGQAITQYQENKGAAPAPAAPQVPAKDGDPAPAADPAPASDPAPAAPQEPDKLQLIKDRRDRRDSEGVPDDPEQQKALITEMDSDIGELIGLIEAAQASNDFAQTAPGAAPAAPNADAAKGDGEGTEEPKTAQDGACEPEKPINADSKDSFRDWYRIVRVGEKLNMDGEGLLSMSMASAKKAIIAKVRPGMRLDGKGDAYINAAYDLAVGELETRKSTNDQRKQMFNADSARKAPTAAAANFKTSGAAQARQKMLEKRNGGNN